MSENDHKPRMYERVLSYDRERTRDLRMDWEQYICYLLEVDRDDVNTDELSRLADVLGGVIGE